jgi:hypothetical protein
MYHPPAFEKTTRRQAAADLILVWGSSANAEALSSVGTVWVRRADHRCHLLALRVERQFEMADRAAIERARLRQRVGLVTMADK